MLAMGTASALEAAVPTPRTATAALPAPGHGIAVAAAGTESTWMLSTVGATACSGHSSVVAAYAPMNAAVTPAGTSTPGRNGDLRGGSARRSFSTGTYGLVAVARSGPTRPPRATVVSSTHASAMRLRSAGSSSPPAGRVSGAVTASVCGSTAGGIVRVGSAAGTDSAGAVGETGAADAVKAKTGSGALVREQWGRGADA